MSLDLSAYLTDRQQPWRECIEACLACWPACEACADACPRESDVAVLAGCIRLDRDCAQACAAAACAMVCLRDDATRQCRGCADWCERCAAECERHAHGHCAACTTAAPRT